MARTTLRALALVAGAVPALAFPAPGLWWLAWVGLVPFLLVLRQAPSGREAAVLGWLGGTGFLLGVHHWLLPWVHVFLPLVLLAVGLLWLPFGWLAWWLLREPVTVRRLLAALAVLPAGWLGIELVRSWESLGGPWGLLGASQWQLPAALSLAALGGVWLVTVAVVTVNVAVAACCGSVGGAGVRPAAAAAAVAVAAGMLGWHAVWPGPPVEGAVRVAAVQIGEWADPAERFDRQERLTRTAVAGAGQDVDLVVWGESGVGFPLPDRPDLRDRLAELSGSVGAPLLVNIDARAAEGGIYKSAVLVDEGGVTGSYAKTRLVPFGEYVPLRPLLGWLAEVTQVAAEDRRRGSGPAVLPTGSAQVGPLVCFESAFPDMTRTLAADGAELVVVQSSTWTFQDSWAPEQHASLAALRAAESGVPVLHATLTGTTAAYDARGRQVAGPLATDEAGVVVAELPLGSGGTPYVDLGPWVPVVAAGILAGALVTAAAALPAARRTRSDTLDLTCAGEVAGA